MINLSSFSDFLTVSASEIPDFHKEIPDVHKEIRLFALPFFGAEKKSPPRIFKAIYRPHEFDEKI